MFLKKIITGSKLSICISIFSLCISILAIAISYASYREERELILKAKFSKKDSFRSIVVQPISTESHFLIGEAFFPESLVNEPVKIDCSGNFRWVETIYHQCEDIIIKKFKPKKGYIQISEGMIPLVIKSYYAAHGKTYTDISLYYLDIMFTRGEYEGDISVRFNGLLFAKQFDWNEQKVSIHKMLDEIWNSKESVYIPYKKPSLFPW